MCLQKNVEHVQILPNLAKFSPEQNREFQTPDPVDLVLHSRSLAL